MKKRILSIFTMMCILATFMPTLIAKANSTRYKVFEQKMTFEEAEEYCNSIGGHLVSIT